MTFYCDGCEINRDFRKDYGILVIDSHNVLKRFCRTCVKPKVSVPDVYFDGKPEENLADDPRTGKPRVFASKAEKAAYLKDRGIVEAGDRVHGAPAMAQQSQKSSEDSRHAVRMALKQVREMGQDFRRQEYLRIVKERSRHA